MFWLLIYVSLGHVGLSLSQTTWRAAGLHANSATWPFACACEPAMTMLLIYVLPCLFTLDLYPAHNMAHYHSLLPSSKNISKRISNFRIQYFSKLLLSSRFHSTSIALRLCVLLGFIVSMFLCLSITTSFALILLCFSNCFSYKNRFFLNTRSFWSDIELFYQHELLHLDTKKWTDVGGHIRFHSALIN